MKSRELFIKIGAKNSGFHEKNLEICEKMSRNCKPFSTFFSFNFVETGEMQKCGNLVVELGTNLEKSVFGCNIGFDIAEKELC